MTPINSTPIAARRRTATHVGRTIRGAVVGLTVAVVGTVAVGAPTEARVDVRNELADEINAAAELAVAAYDDLLHTESLDDLLETDSLGDYLEYARHRTATARLAARELGFDEFQFVDAWKNAPRDHQRAVLAAMTQVGVPYRSHASVEGEGFDCSGLTSFAWSESGLELFRQSGAQIRDAERLTMDEAKAGDLAHYPGHVMMYLGVETAVVHSVNTGRTVEVDTIAERKFGSLAFGDPTGG